MFHQTHIGTLLHTDHMATIETLQKLEELVRRHRSVPVMDALLAEQLTALSATLRREVESHFGFEENHLFPVFTEQGESGIVMMLTHEHRTILPLANRVADLAAQAAKAGFSAEEWIDFRDCATELVEREIFHIQKEEMGLLAAISALVKPETDARLAETYAQVM